MTEEFTLGVEEEFQIVDPQSRELRNVISQLLDASTPLDEIELQKELHQSMVEVATGICANVQEARRDVIKNRKQAAAVAQRVGMKIAAASTHPFSKWQEQTISEDERYHDIVGELQDVARANLIFGMHVHVGIPDQEEAMAVFAQARYFLPHFLALSTSSPFFGGRMTGLKSTRTFIFKRFPRTGIPEPFPSYREFERFVDGLVKTGCIDDGRRIWWDLRPSVRFNTVEFRICDVPTRVRDVVALTAVIQGVVAKLVWLHRRNLSFRTHAVAYMDENKWRAARYGVRGKLIDFGAQKQVEVRKLVDQLIAFVGDIAKDLGSEKEIDDLRLIAEEGTSADRQIQRYEESGGDLKAVVDLILDETMEHVSSGRVTAA